jgi:ABC-2 type transport system permease protein
MKVFWAFTRQAFHNTVVFRFEFWLRFVSVFLVMYSIYWVWTVLYTQRPGAFGVSLEQMVTYGVLGMALEIFLDVGPEWYMATQVRSGAIDTDLMKPMDFHLHMLARSTGEMLFSLGVMALPSFAAAHYLFGVQFPRDAATGLLFALSLVFSFLVFFHLGFLLGSLVLVTLDIRSISWAYYSLVSFFAGQVVPLWLFPDFLRGLAEALPFKSVYYIPMSIYIGTFTGESALRAIGFQAAWAAVLMLVSRWAWSRVQARLIVQGG